MAIQPGPGGYQASSRGGDTAELRLRGRRRRRPLLALLFALIGTGGLALAGYLAYGQIQPRKFTVAQQKRIEAWEVARRWRTTPKGQIFPAVVAYRIAGSQLGSAGSLTLHARRLEIAGQAPCAKAVGTNPSMLAILRHDGCQALLRATYADATGSIVLTVGFAVLKDQASAMDVARYLGKRAVTGQGTVTRQLILHPFRVVGSPAALFGTRQRQLSWVVAAGPYLVLATAGYADGRPHVAVSSDSYSYLEMTSLARAVVATVAAPLGAPAPVPHCPGALPAC
ncbi:MAG TPA: hypothetical protein VF834_02415 [Streptosporangiaceae bacterium]